MADTIDQLNENTPTDVNLLSDIPPDIRGTKKALRGTFADLGASGGVVNITANEFNSVAGVTSNIQGQIDAKPQPIAWTLRNVPDLVNPPFEVYDLQLNTKNIVVFQNFPTSTDLICNLPDKTLASDGDICHVTGGIVTSDAEFNLSSFSAGQPFRYLVTNGFDPNFNQWTNATIVNVTNPFPWPALLCFFSSQYDQWIVRIQNDTVETFYS